MPTLLQRLRALTADDATKRRNYLAARKWVRDRSPDHEVHLGGATFRLLPEGGLDAVAAWNDDQLRAYMELCVIVMLQYRYGFQPRA